MGKKLNILRVGDKKISRVQTHTTGNLEKGEDEVIENRSKSEKNLKTDKEKEKSSPKNQDDEGKNIRGKDQK